MNPTIKQKLKLAVEAAIIDEATVPEKALAARKLADAISETIDAIGPKRAGKLMRSVMMQAEALHPPPTHEATLEETLEILSEMDQQKQRLN